MTGLRVVQDSWRHLLTFALRFDHHFLRQPIEEELDVYALSPGGRVLRPVAAQGSGRLRHEDGTYRFTDLPDGVYPVVCAVPSGDFVSWDPPLTVAAPLAQPGQAVARDLWPTPQATLPGGMTVVRGKLRGAGAGAKVEIAGATEAFTRFTRADPSGELVFAVPARIKSETDGRIKLKISIDGGGSAVTSIDVLSDRAETFVGPNFSVFPGRASRVRFNV
jgi:hypothetical protein